MKFKTSPCKSPISHQRMRGFVLVISLLTLILLTILAVSMSKSFISQEYIAGSTREKLRAFESAQAALNYAEAYLNSYQNTNNNLPVSKDCTSTTTSENSSVDKTVVSICKTDINHPEQVENWGAFANQLPAYGSIPISAQGGISGTNTTYYALPKFYIYDLGCLPLGSPICTQQYRITALGYGGNSNAVAVVQSIFAF